MKPTMALLRKDLLLERRAPESVPAMLLFSITTFVLFHFGLGRDAVEGSLAAGVLLVTILFAAVLGINRLFVSEQAEGGFDSVLLAPIDRTALFLAKACALFLFLALVELVAVPAFAILLLGPSPWGALPGLIVVLALVNGALAVVGTLVSALAIRTRSRDLIVPIVALPLLVPALIAAARCCAPLLAEGGASWPAAKWLLVLGLYDLVFGLLAYAVFDFLMED
ncbi:heme exporter protein CcmB [Conexibacter woesei]|uniref:Heme exporter protein B n=1 Tax=Conexibacter woesei (strain DSM 14684 / CCUG 47730 / CIP 108061 / JCM 11494 / NBRC 100937 / ID131577) TaxID=469383 RepID=D3F2Z4_CONWI|nr:heme exporter protein CcmB [Conexibacter woesei]ADB54275.1 cytochrome c-type biogenesis protein CcmB [Conexibacter woesei DSM 14684]